MNLKQLIQQHIYSAPLSQLPFGDKRIITTINAHSYCVSKKDRLFESALLKSDILLPDGSGIVLAARILIGKKIKKIAGADIHEHLLLQANTHAQKVFYLGSSERTLGLIEERINKEYPHIVVGISSPPFKPELSDADTALMVAKVNEFEPDILFVGMTAPKQEKWVYLNQDRIAAGTIASIGAVFDFYAGTVKRSGPVWIALGLEWLARTIQDPVRMGKRNFISIPKFLLEILSLKIFGKGCL